MNPVLLQEKQGIVLLFQLHISIQQSGERLLYRSPLFVLIFLRCILSLPGGSQIFQQCLAHHRACRLGKRQPQCPAASRTAIPHHPHRPSFSGFYGECFCSSFIVLCGSRRIPLGHSSPHANAPVSRALPLWKIFRQVLPQGRQLRCGYYLFQKPFSWYPPM